MYVVHLASQRYSCAYSTLRSSQTNTHHALTADVDPLAAATLAANTSVLSLSPLAPVNDIARCNGTANHQTSAETYVATAYTPNTEPVNIYLAPIVAASTAISYQIDLSAFKDTIMELNKNIYFGVNLVLTINWNSCTKIGFNNTTNTGALTTGPTTFTVPLQLNNLFYTQLQKRTLQLFQN